MTKTASSILIFSLLFGSNLTYASSEDCKGGKCVATFAKQEKSSNRQKENIHLMMTAYHNAEKKSLHQPFTNLQAVNDFISTDIVQNNIMLDDQPLLTNLTPSIEELDSGKVIEEDGKIIILLDEEPITIEYKCTNEKAVVVCDAELRECECV